MARRSNKSIAEILSPINVSFPDQNENGKHLALVDKKIALATEGFNTHKFCELVLRDRSRLSEENALAICDYIIAMKREVNPRLSYKRYTIQVLAELSKAVGIDKKFIDITRDDILLCYLDKCRKPENEDPFHKWIGSYNTKLVTISRFFKWLYYPNVEDPKRRNELSAHEKKPDCIMGIKLLKRKEISCYKPFDLWTQEDDLVFLKWVTNKRDRCYHTMARDLSARPLKIMQRKWNI
jgi:integrase/recombinase XerD